MDALLLRTGVVDADTILADDDNALYIAARYGSVTVVETLLRAGALVDSHGRKKHTALTAAVYCGSEAIVQILLNAGPSIYRRSEALHAAVTSGSSSVVEMLITAGANMDPLFSTDISALAKAITRGKIGVASILIRAGVDVNRSCNGRTPLLWAVIEGHSDLVDMLLQAGANYDHPDAGGRTIIQGDPKG